MQKLSVVVSAYNEERNIEKCLKSVTFADEIILVDNQSSDKTKKIASKYTKKIFTRANNIMLNKNKNFGFTKAGGDWILSLDADEQVTMELRKEILQVIKAETEINGYWIPRKNIIFGKWIEHSIWWPDYQLRLFRRGKGRFPERHVHEYIEVKGQTEKLVYPLMHDNYTSISQFIQKMDRVYSENEVESYILKRKRVEWQDAVIFPLKDFMKTFFAQGGYKDGLHGLVLSILQAFYAEVVFAKIWERQKFTEYNSSNFLSEILEVFKQEGYELRHWVLSSKIEEDKSRVKKIANKIRRRLNKRNLS